MAIEPPEEIFHVGMSQFSIARYYGGIRFNGREYVYDPSRDALVRDDVVRARAKDARAAKADAKAAKASRIKASEGPGLFDGDEAAD